MSRTNVNIDDEACAEIMRRYRLTSKRGAINLALRVLAAEPLDVDEAKQLARVGLGWWPRRNAVWSLNVILIDTSAWVEFLRDTGSAVCTRVEALKCLHPLFFPKAEISNLTHERGMG